MLDFVKNISPVELGAIALILIVFFGSKLVTGFAKTSGETLREMKKIKKNFTEAMEDNEPAKGKKG